MIVQLRKVACLASGLLCFLPPNLAMSAPDTKSPPENQVRIGDENTEFTFDPSQAGRLISIKHLPTGTEFMPQAGAGSSVWRVVVRDTEKKLHTIECVGTPSIKKQDEDRGFKTVTLEWSKLDIGEDKGVLDVTVRVQIAPGGLTRWNISVTDRSKISALWEVQFPCLSHLGPVGEPNEDMFLDPLGTGRKTPNPYKNLAETNALHYPGYASFQMCALYNQSRAGLYFASYDGHGYFKRFNFSPGADAKDMNLWLANYPEGQGIIGTNYQMPFNVVIGAFSGDWWTAAKMYRDWTVNQEWCSKGPLATRKDVPAWYKATSVEFIGGLDLPRMEAWKKSLGTGYMNHWNYMWKHPGQGDAGTPDLFPPASGAQFQETVKKAKEDGIRLVPYLGGSIMDKDSPQYKEWNAAPWVVKTEDGAPYEWNLDFTNAKDYKKFILFPWICPATPFWQDKVAGIVRQIMSYGVDGVYFDTTTGNCYQCFSPDHGHPVGGGNYWAEGTRQVLERARVEIKKANPEGVLTGEEPSEIYIDKVDGYLLFGIIFPWSVPAFQAIYHDYICLYGISLSTPKVMGKDYDFSLPAGICFIEGDQLGWFGQSADMMKPEREKEMRFLRNLVHFRAQCFEKFLGEGEMVRPPKLEGTMPEVSGAWMDWPKNWGGKVLARPAVLHSEWKAADGSVGLAFLNISSEPREVSFALHPEDFGFEKDARLTATSVTLTDAEAPERKPFDLATPIKKQLAPYEVWGLELKNP